MHKFKVTNTELMFAAAFLLFAGNFVLATEKIAPPTPAVAGVKIAAAPNCIDTDGGQTSETYGSVKFKQNGKTITVADRCQNNGRVIEAWCNPTSPRGYSTTQIACPAGCMNGRCIPVPPTISAAKNNLVIDKNVTNPTGIVGDKAIVVASLVLSNTNGSPTAVTGLTFSDNANSSCLGSVIHKLFVQTDANGKAISTPVSFGLGCDAPNTYTIRFSSPLAIQKNVPVTVSLLGDPRNGTATELPIQLKTITVQKSTGSDIPFSQTVNLQTVFVKSSGTLTVSAVSSSASVATVGQAGVVLGNFTISADEVEDLKLSTLAFTVVSPSASNVAKAVSNLKLYDSTTGKLLDTLTSLTRNGATTLSASFTPMLTIAQNTAKTLELRGDISNTNALTGTEFRVGLVDNAGQVVGVNSKKTGTLFTKVSGHAPSDLPGAFAAPLSLLNTDLSSDWSASTPGGLSTGGTNQVVAKVTLTGSDIGLTSPSLQAITFEVTTTIAPPATGDVRYARLYSSSLSNSPLFEKALTASDWNKPVTFTGMPVIADFAPGQSKTLFFTLDTVQAQNGDRLSVRVPQGGILWTDGVVNNIPLNKGLPLEAKVLTY